MFQPTLFGRYVLLERLAAGGMGEVFTAVPIHLWGYGKFFALKRILPKLSGNPEFLQRFRDEVRLVLPMNHPNVVQVFEVGRVAHELYVVMELVQGLDLRGIMRRAFRRGPATLSIAAALHIVKEILAGLHYCHQHRDGGKELGIVHRDVCPSNVLVSYEGAVKLADFGLALSEFKAVKTDPHNLMGHLGYIAPEHVARGPVDHRADIYSAGVLLFELLTGERFLPPGDLSTIYRAKHTRRPPRPSNHRRGVPPAVDRLVATAVSVDPNDRFATARELLEGIQKVLACVDPTFGPATLAETVIDPFFRAEERQRRLRDLQGLDLAGFLETEITPVSTPLDDETLSYPIQPGAARRSAPPRAASWTRRGSPYEGSLSDEDTDRWTVSAMIGKPLRTS
jgi:serine/threonine protein kinase